MAEFASLELRRLHRRLNRLLQEFSGVPVAMEATRGAWLPAINAYWTRDRLIICAELAGLDRSAIDLQVEPRRVCLRGHRELPDPPKNTPPLDQILAMEINHGPFERIIDLPAAVDAAQTKAEYRSGMLWILLPFASTTPGNV
jgi:HSP20 family protein